MSYDFEITADDNYRISLDSYLDITQPCPIYYIRKGTDDVYIIRVDNNMYFQTVKNGQVCKTDRSTFSRFSYGSTLGANSAAKSFIRASVEKGYSFSGGYYETLPTAIMDSRLLGIKMYYAGLYGKPLLANPFDSKYAHLPFASEITISESASEIKPHMDIKKYLEEL